jgi:hypothetical protein
MWRRQFIGLIGGAAAWPLAARGQQKARYPTIGVVGPASTNDEEARRAFESACSEFGWVEGRNIHIVYRRAESSQMRAVVAEVIGGTPSPSQWNQITRNSLRRQGRLNGGLSPFQAKRPMVGISFASKETRTEIQPIGHQNDEYEKSSRAKQPNLG